MESVRKNLKLLIFDLLPPMEYLLLIRETWTNGQKRNPNLFNPVKASNLRNKGSVPISFQKTILKDYVYLSQEFFLIFENFLIRRMDEIKQFALSLTSVLSDNNKWDQIIA